jgi:hypothetical protein
VGRHECETNEENPIDMATSTERDGGTPSVGNAATDQSPDLKASLAIVLADREDAHVVHTACWDRAQ